MYIYLEPFIINTQLAGHLVLAIVMVEILAAIGLGAKETGMSRSSLI